MAADVKNKRSGDKKSGKKITGMQFLGADNSKLLITSNDSRIRLYDGELLLPCHSVNTNLQLSMMALNRVLQ